MTKGEISLQKGDLKIDSPSLSAKEGIKPDSRSIGELEENDPNLHEMTSRRYLLETGTDDAARQSHHQRTLVIYSGPTSIDRLKDKNGMYIDNMNYFLEHGVSCYDDEAQPPRTDHAEPVSVSYVFVVTQDVADYYTAPNGLLTKKIEECERLKENSEKRRFRPFIEVIVRQDRCYDMESMRVVLDQIDVETHYDNLLFLNCGLVGPKFGPGTPALVPSYSKSKQKQQASHNARNDQSEPTMVHYSHWTQLYTSRLTDSVRMVGHSINTHFHTYFPHVQSFLYAVHTDTVPMLLENSIYDCGLTQEELGSNAERRFELINRYEVGMSQSLIKKGYKIATAFINRWEMGQPLVIDQTSIAGTELDDTVSDIWYEDVMRNLTSTMSDAQTKWWRNGQESYDDHKWDILPWDYYMFFKVSRLVPEDIQNEMNYSMLDRSGISVISNDPRKSPSAFWRKTMEMVMDVEPEQLDKSSPLLQSEATWKCGSMPDCFVNFVWKLVLMGVVLFVSYSKKSQLRCKLTRAMKMRHH